MGRRRTSLSPSLVIPLCLLLTPLAFGQTYTIQSVAGGGLPQNVSGLSVGLNGLTGVALDTSGNVFMTSLKHQGVLRLDGKCGMLTLVAGNGVPGFSGDNGPAIDSQFNQPQGIAVDTAGNIYVSDSANNRIRRISNGVITTIAGTGVAGSAGDNGPAASAELSYQYGIAVDTLGNIYFADSGNHSVREISGGTITTVFRVPQLNEPLAVAVDSAGNIYFTAAGDSAPRAYGAVFEISKGQLSLIAGVQASRQTAEAPLCGNGPAQGAPFVSPQGIAVDLAGNVYVADAYENCVREISKGGVTKFAGNGIHYSPPGDGGPAASASLTFPAGVAVDSEGNVYIADSGNGRLRKVSNGIITTIAGGGTAGQSGPAMSSELYTPLGLATDSAGNLYFADSGNRRVGRLSNGAITTLAGSGIPGYIPDGTPALSADLITPVGVALDSVDNAYIADSAAGIFRISNGLLSSVPVAMSFSSPVSPAGVGIDGAGKIYISTGTGNSILQESNGAVSLTVPSLGFPKGLAVDGSGNLYIAASRDNQVSLFSNGLLTPWVGNATAGFSGDGGLAIAAQLSGDAAVAFGSDGSLYIADTGNNRVRRVTNGVITTIAGNGNVGFGGDGGPALSAPLNAPAGISVDRAGNVYVSDTGNNRIRELTPSSAPFCSALLSTDRCRRVRPEAASA